MCLDTQDTEEIIRTVQLLAPVYGGINLEDIAAPRCFEIEARLRELLDIPVFHDDQHGTAVVVLAALRNALRVVGKEMNDVRVVVCGVGAAGSAIIRLLLPLRPGHVTAVDVDGIVAADRAGMDVNLAWIAAHTNADGLRGSVADALVGADVFIGVSAPGLFGADEVATMNSDAIVFALANPDPEIDPAEAQRHAAVVATGRSDYPNQINNVLAFPGIFRGLLDAGASDITDGMMVAASAAIADVVAEPNASFIIPQRVRLLGRPRGGRRGTAGGGGGIVGGPGRGRGGHQRTRPGMNPRLSHTDASGAARMVDVSAKDATARVAVATGTFRTTAQVLELISADGLPKGDAVATARIAGIMAAKRTAELVPLCHPLALTGVSVELTPGPDTVEITATVRTTGPTGVEMEALTAVAVAGLTLHDMVKAVDPAATMDGVRVVRKAGGKSGEWTPRASGATGEVPRASGATGEVPRASGATGGCAQGERGDGGCAQGERSDGGMYTVSVARVIVASNRASAGVYEDATGPLIVAWLRERGIEVGEPAVVADGEPVARALLEAIEAEVDLVLTTGGTGISPTDRTPQLTAPLLDYEVPGLADAVRAAGADAGAHLGAVAWRGRGGRTDPDRQPARLEGRRPRRLGRAGARVDARPRPAPGWRSHVTLRPPPLPPIVTLSRFWMPTNRERVPIRGGGEG